jgi:transcriptional regulator with XRE-family HTH domain
VSREKVQADRLTLKSARIRLEMDQADLAREAGLSQATVSDFEIGKTKPHEATRAAIQTALEARGIVFTNGDKPGFYLDKGKAALPA